MSPRQDANGTGPASWIDDLTPIGPQDWSRDRASHLLERAGFGGPPEEVGKLAAISPAAAVGFLVDYQHTNNSHLQPFDHSGIHDPGLEPFPPSRPATTNLAKKNGAALGIKVKLAGNRRMQAIVNKFFYWLRASQMETNRLAYWWANRMVATNRPLEEKMALFWHGHFGVSENKVRDYRKMLGHLQLFYAHGTGNFRNLMISVAQDPAMLVFLDAGVNVKGAPNENFAREIMELFTMGVGNYSERDIREAARAFTGWNAEDLKFVIDADKHDAGEKTILGRTGAFDGVKAIDIILEQPATANFVAGKIYRYFVRQELSASLQKRLGDTLRTGHYEIAPLLRTIFLSKDFYSPASVGTSIKSPVQLVVSTYRKLGLRDAPGIPDFTSVTTALGQSLFRPPTVAGWSEGRSWVTPGLLMERGNFGRDTLFPDIGFLPSDRYAYDTTIRAVGKKIAEGVDIAAATIDDKGGDQEGMAESNLVAGRDEDFNTRYASFRGWQMAMERVKPIPRHTAQIALAAMVRKEGLQNTTQVVDYFIARFMRVAPADEQRRTLIAFLDKELGTTDLKAAETFMEDSLRMLLHLIMSAPEYQLA